VITARGVMLIYTNKEKVGKYWKKNLRFEELHDTKKENKKTKQKIEDVIKKWNAGKIPKATRDLKTQISKPSLYLKWMSQCLNE
jgi:ribosomal protein L13